MASPPPSKTSNRLKRFGKAAVRHIFDRSRQGAPSTSYPSSLETDTTSILSGNSTVEQQDSQGVILPNAHPSSQLHGLKKNQTSDTTFSPSYSASQETIGTHSRRRIRLMRR